MPVTIGTIVPDFHFQTADGSGQLSEELRKAEKTLLIFSRYLGCPFCQLDLLSYCEEYIRFQEKHTQILLVLQSAPETIRRQTLLPAIPFSIICDPDMELYRLFQIPSAKSTLSMMALNRKFLKKSTALLKRRLKHGAYEGNEQQLPALFVLDQESKVLHAHYASNLSDMPDVEEMLRLL